jgi:hypothetical protein
MPVSRVKAGSVSGAISSVKFAKLTKDSSDAVRDAGSSALPGPPSGADWLQPASSIVTIRQRDGSHDSVIGLSLSVF